MQDKEAIETTGEHFFSGAPAYLATHRSLAACQRELTRLTTTLTKEVEAIGDARDDKPVIRRTPDRCILQLDSAAVTVAWLRSTVDSVAEGRLLVMVWRGTIAGRSKFTPERPSSSPKEGTATILWQDTLAAEATSEESWMWRSEGPSGAQYACDALASLALDHLRSALKAAA